MNDGQELPEEFPKKLENRVCQRCESCMKKMEAERANKTPMVEEI